MLEFPWRSPINLGSSMSLVLHKVVQLLILNTVQTGRASSYSFSHLFEVNDWLLHYELGNASTP